MNTLLLNTGAGAASPAATALPPAAAANPVAEAGFAQALAGQQAEPDAAAAAPTQDPTLPALLQALLGDAPAALPDGTADGAADIGETAPAGTDAAGLAALAALGLWQAPAAAAMPPAASAPAPSGEGPPAAAAAVPAGPAAASVLLPSQQLSLQQPSQQELGLVQLRLQQQGEAQAMPAAAGTTESAAVGMQAAQAGTEAAALSGETRKLLERLGAGQGESAPAQDGAAQPLDLGGQGGLNLEGGKAASASAGQAATLPSVELKGEPRQWQQPLMQALGDRLQLQIAGRSEQAVIKLSPPLLGQVEIAIRQQAGELQVRMSASHGEVARQLQHVSESLRQDLVQRHSGEVTVQVSQTARDGEARGAGRDAQSQQQQAQEQREQEQQRRRPGLALNEEGAAAGAFGLASDRTTAADGAA